MPLIRLAISLPRRSFSFRAQCVRRVYHQAKCRSNEKDSRRFAEFGRIYTNQVRYDKHYKHPNGISCALASEQTSPPQKLYTLYHALRMHATRLILLLFFFIVAVLFLRLPFQRASLLKVFHFSPSAHALSASLSRGIHFSSSPPKYWQLECVRIAPSVFRIVMQLTSETINRASHAFDTLTRIHI